MCIFHRWSKWMQYSVNIPARHITKNWGLAPAVEYRQSRVCEKCGKVKDVLIRMNVSD